MDVGPQRVDVKVNNSSVDSHLSSELIPETKESAGRENNKQQFEAANLKCLMQEHLEN